MYPCFHTFDFQTYRSKIQNTFNLRLLLLCIDVRLPFNTQVTAVNPLLLLITGELDIHPINPMCLMCVILLLCFLKTNMGSIQTDIASEFYIISMSGIILLIT